MRSDKERIHRYSDLLHQQTGNESVLEYGGGGVEPHTIFVTPLNFYPAVSFSVLCKKCTYSLEYLQLPRSVRVCGGSKPAQGVTGKPPSLNTRAPGEHSLSELQQLRL